MTVLVALGLLALSGTAGGPVAEASPVKQHISWLAAGDSYSAGEGLPHPSGKCDQALPSSGSKTWAQVAWEHIHTAGQVFAAPDLVACTGAVTSNLFESVDKAGVTEWAPSRGTYDLVTFTFGGNDIGFADIIKQCIGVSLTSLPTDGALHWCPADSTIRARITNLADTYRTFLKNVADRIVNPGGNVVVMGYPEFVELPDFWHRWEKAVGLCWGLAPVDASELRGLAGDLNATIGQAVADENALAPNRVHLKFVDVNGGGGGIALDDANLFEPSSGARHNLCSAGTPWLNGLNASDAFHGINPGGWTNGSFHPNQAGVDAEGGLAAAVISRLDWSTLGPAKPRSLPETCGVITGRVGGMLTVSVVNGTVSCPDALRVAKGYQSLPESQVMGSAAVGHVGAWTCASTSGTDFQQTGHASDCEYGNQRISLDAASGATKTGRILSTDGIGPINFGMSIQQAEAVTGAVIVTREAGNGASCLQGQSTALPGAVLAIVNGNVVAAGADYSSQNDDWRTPSGFHYGTPITSIQMQYPGRLASRPYLSSPGYTEYDLIVSGGHAISFIVDDASGTVTSMAAGASENVVGVESICV